MAELKRDSVQALEEIVVLINESREEGNKFFEVQLFDEACRWYTECINMYICVEKMQEIRGNSTLYSCSMSTFGLNEIQKGLNLARSSRSEAFLQQEKYESALVDAEELLEFDVKDAKALDRKGQALEGLQQFEKAHRSFEAALELNPTDDTIQKSVRRTWICFLQSQGQYDPSDPYLHLGIGDTPFCEYVGPLEIQLLPGRGRGLVLLEAVVAGQVLLASKALAFTSMRNDNLDMINSLSSLAARCEKCRRKLRTLQAKPYETEGVHKVTTPSNLGAPVARCRDEIDEPNMAVSGDLPHSKRPRKDAEGELLSTVPEDTITSGSGSLNSVSYRPCVPPMDLFKPCKLSDHHREGPGDHQELTDNDEDEVDEGEDPVDKLDIRSIVQLNGFAPIRYCHDYAFPVEGADPPDLSKEDMVGLWLLPSFLNHSCIPNCRAVNAGEEMVVRARKDIPKGEELTITYFNIFHPHKRRLISGWQRNFFCSCSRCCLEESIQAQLETLNVTYQKYLDKKTLDAESNAECDYRIQVRLLSTTGMTCDEFVKELETVMSNATDMDEIQRNWIRASYLDAYFGKAAVLPMNSKERIDSLKQVAEASTIVQSIDTIDLQYYSMLVQEVGSYYGKGSSDFRQVERKLMKVLGDTYGVAKRSAALKLIKRLQSIP